MTWWWVALGGAVGAPLRYAVDVLLTGSRTGPGFPRGTFATNLGGSFLLGLLIGATPSATLAALLGTGFCGALTTYSTFGFETVRLAEEGRWRLAASYVVASLVAGLAAVSAGWWLGGLAT
ncbi:fluoride efflux transporter CrcB [Nocardioides sambongensis]|uniref:fluoride efflux transporter CrcB n=1 Tax=Nocardioides sambongensis TaxID=2589074 RepID=UPI00112D4715|nr:fluoride efflux transporter CrcB [Nocardioides sambongensis]